MPDRFVDERGEILDILPGPIDCVTRITSVAGAVRGNHRHLHTVQWALVLSGRLLVVTEDGESRTRREYGPGEMAEDRPGTAHAWKSLTDTVVLVFTRGPRSGADFELDTERLKVPLLT
jgi:quercetin dioxygenase-like cupin family protein